MLDDLTSRAPRPELVIVDWAMTELVDEDRGGVSSVTQRFPVTTTAPAHPGSSCRRRLPPSSMHPSLLLRPSGQAGQAGQSYGKLLAVGVIQAPGESRSRSRSRGSRRRSSRTASSFRGANTTHRHPHVSQRNGPRQRKRPPPDGSRTGRPTAGDFLALRGAGHRTCRSRSSKWLEGRSAMPPTEQRARRARIEPRLLSKNSVDRSGPRRRMATSVRPGR